MKRIVHPIPPLYDSNSKILILGSFPSVKSREEMFFYGHKQNRFWKTVSAVLNVSAPETVEEKKAMLLSHGIALWDVIGECEISGSSDSSITNEKVNDITPILNTACIKAVFTNGKKAHGLYVKKMQPLVNIEAVYLPSTSPANAAFSLENLIDKWKVIGEIIET